MISKAYNQQHLDQTGPRSQPELKLCSQESARAQAPCDHASLLNYVSSMIAILSIHSRDPMECSRDPAVSTDSLYPVLVDHHFPTLTISTGSVHTAEMNCYGQHRLTMSTNKTSALTSRQTTMRSATRKPSPRTDSRRLSTRLADVSLRPKQTFGGFFWPLLPPKNWQSFPDSSPFLYGTGCEDARDVKRCLSMNSFQW